MTQLAVMRELLCVFNGNELVLGIILGNWLLLTGMGSWLGRKSDQLQHPERWLMVSQMLVGILPLVQIFAVRALRNVVFLPGAMPSLTQTVVSSFMLLLPFCLVSGYMLALGCSVLAHLTPESSGETPQEPAGGDARATVGQVYVADCVGSILGGVAFSFVFIRYFDHFGLLCVPALLNLFIALALALHMGNRLLAGVISFFIGLVGFACFIDIDAASTALEYPQQQIIFRGNSPYGKWIVGQSAGQFNFIQNGLPMFSTDDLQQVEETVHYAMAQRPEADQVLLVAGGISGSAKEIFKYGVKQVTYVELDPLLLQVGRKFLPDALADARIQVVNTDGRLFIKQNTQRFDVIIIDLPDPSTSQLNRFFTAEFFAATKRVLAPNGVLSFGLGRYENYISPELARLLAMTQGTLKESFENVLALPGGRIFFLASDGALESNLAARLEAHKIITQYVNRHYLNAMFTPDRLTDVRQAAAGTASVNKDFSPVLYFYQFRYWLSQFGFKFGVLEGIFALCFLVYLVRLRGAPLAIFASGFAASALEVVLLLGFQILCGSLYYQLGVIVTMFMAGLAAGGFWMNRKAREKEKTTDEHRWTQMWQRKLIFKLAFGVAVFAAVLPFILRLLLSTSSSLIFTQTVIAGLTFLLAVLVGAEFPLASAAAFQKPAATASRLYTADLVGACLGALLASTLLIPLIGLPATCFATAGLNLIGGVAVLLGKGS